jgi:hypothetical protein
VKRTTVHRQYAHALLENIRNERTYTPEEAPPYRVSIDSNVWPCRPFHFLSQPDVMRCGRRVGSTVCGRVVDNVCIATPSNWRVYCHSSICNASHLADREHENLGVEQELRRQKQPEQHKNMPPPHADSDRSSDRRILSNGNSITRGSASRVRGKH